MAIGDTVQAGLMRIDPSAIERAGQANAKANQAFGNALGEVAKGYFVGQEKKARANEIKEELMRSGLPEEAAANISKNPFLQKEHARKQEAENRMNIARLAQRSAGDALAQKAAFEETRVGEKEASQEKIAEAEANQMGMAEALLAETPDPAVLERRKAVAQVDYNLSQPGLFALGGDQGARNRFLEYQRDEAPKLNAPKVLGGELGSSDFGRFAKEQNLDPVLASSRFMNLQKAEADLAESNRIDPKDAIELKNKQETTRQLFDKPLTDLSANFDKNKQVQDYKNVVISFDTISAAAENPSAAGDLSLIFAYMKVLDPTSTVREGEFANAQNAGGIPTKIRNLFNNWTVGERLEPQQRLDFVTQANKLVGARRKSIDPVIRQTRQKFDRQIKNQNRNLAPEQADLLFEEVIFPDIRTPRNVQSQEQPPQDPNGIGDASERALQSTPSATPLAPDQPSQATQSARNMILLKAQNGEPLTPKEQRIVDLLQKKQAQGINP